VVDDGLDYLIPRWEGVVQEVVNGYDAMDLEYLNDMDVRHIIEAVWPLASDAQRGTYERRLNDADRRLLAVTEPVPECIWGVRNEAEQGYTRERDWYYYRVPKVKGPNW